MDLAVFYSTCRPAAFGVGALPSCHAPRPSASNAHPANTTPANEGSARAKKAPASHIGTCNQSLDEFLGLTLLPQQS